MRSAQAVYRPQSRNVVAPRKTQRTVVVREQNIAPRKRRKQARKTSRAPLPNGLSVMGLLVVVLAAIGGMLVVSLGWQRNAHSLAQEEVALRSSLDNVADERQQLVVDERRASNPRLTAARAADAGLSEIKLDERTAMTKPVAKVTKPVATTSSALRSVSGKNANGGVGQVPNLPHNALAVAPKVVKRAVGAATTKPVATTTTVAKAAPPVPQKTERTTIPAMPPSIAKTASVKATLAR